MFEFIGCKWMRLYIKWGLLCVFVVVVLFELWKGIILFCFLFKKVCLWLYLFVWFNYILMFFCYIIIWLYFLDCFIIMFCFLFLSCDYDCLCFCFCFLLFCKKFKEFLFYKKFLFFMGFFFYCCDFLDEFILKEWVEVRECGEVFRRFGGMRE